jgi:hypothetical protein
MERSWSFPAWLVLLLVIAHLASAAAVLPVRWQPAVELARGPGVRGPWQQNESRYDFVDDPSVALAEDGSLVVAWVDQARKAVLVQRRARDGAPAAAPVEVDRQPHTFSWIPRLAVAPDVPQHVLVLWQEIIFSGGSHAGEMMFARSGDGGRTFSPPLNLSRSRGGDGKGRINPAYWHNGSYDLAAGAGRRVYAAWTEYEGALWFSTSADGGLNFSAPRQLAGGRGQRPARAPSLAVGPRGEVYLAWTTGDDPGADIHVARSEDFGATFTSAQAVAPSPAYSDAPRLAVDARGVLHLAYAESDGAPLQRQRVLYLRSTDGARTFEPPRVLTQTLPRPYVSAGYPSLAVDRQTGVYVLWELQDDPGKRPRALGMAVSWNGGNGFSEAGVVPQSSDPAGGYNGSSQGLLVNKLSVNARGDIAVVNSSLREGSHSRVWLMRGQRQQ